MMGSSNAFRRCEYAATAAKAGPSVPLIPTAEEAAEKQISDRMGPRYLDNGFSGTGIHSASLVASARFSAACEAVGFHKIPFQGAYETSSNGPDGTVLNTAVPSGGFRFAESQTCG